MQAIRFIATPSTTTQAFGAMAKGVVQKVPSSGITGNQ